MKERDYDIIVVGGSAGSIQILLDILEHIPAAYCVPVVLVVHRMKNVHSELHRILSVNKRIIEPEDKQPIKECSIYLAPQNYHLLVEEDKSFSLDYSELVNYSRPSIDVTFSSICDTFGKKVLAVLLSGANNDGAQGMAQIIRAGGTGIVQSPDTAAYPAMPNAAIDANAAVKILLPEDIVKYIVNAVV